MHWPHLLLYACCALLLGSCAQPREVRFFPPEAYPSSLSEWGIIYAAGDRLLLGKEVIPYDLNTPLFSDYAQKLRTLYIPPGTSIGYRRDDVLDLPVGTILSKTFFYQRHEAGGLIKAAHAANPDRSTLHRRKTMVLETRLLVRQDHGWDALPYVWDGADARLTIAGSLSHLQLEGADGSVTPLPYIVPTRNECAACHATDHTSGAIRPIGIKARHLNRPQFGVGPNQLAQLASAGRLTGLPAADHVPMGVEAFGNAPLPERARAYLDVNCGHCHNPSGAADTSGLLLDALTTYERALGVCKPPIAAGRGTGGRAYSIVPGEPDASILVFRMETIDPGSRMPELGRSLPHREGIDLISDWIASMPGSCLSEAGVVSGQGSYSRSSTSG